MASCVFCNGENDLINHRVSWIRFSGDVYIVDRNSHYPAMRSCAHSLTVPVCKTHHDGIHNPDITRIGDFSDRFKELSHSQVQTGYNIIEEATRLSWLVPLVDATLIGHDYFEVVSKIGSYYQVVERLAKFADSDRFPIVFPQMFGIKLSPKFKSLSFERKRGDYMTTIVTTRCDFIRHTAMRLLISRSTTASYSSEDYILKHVNDKREVLYTGRVITNPVKNMKTPIRKSELTAALNELVHDERVEVKFTKKKNYKYPIRNYRYVGDA